MKPVVFSVLLAAVASAVCAQIAPSTQAQKQQLAQDIAAIEAEIASAETESAKYAGGLVKSFIDLRLATLKQTRALLDQRQKAGSHAVSLRYTVDGKPFTQPAVDVAVVEAEIAALRKEIEKQQTEADRYSGGLVHAMALSTVATSRQSLAMLEQKRLALKYGLPQFIGFADSVAATPRPSAAPVTSPAQVTAKPAELFEIVEVDARVTESNDSWWKYAWKLTLQNKSTQPLAFNATIEFLDADGFVIDDDSEYGLIVEPGNTKTFTGYDLVTTSSATKVRKTNAKVGLAR